MEFEWGPCADADGVAFIMSPPPSAQDRIPTFLRPSPLRIRLSRASCSGEPGSLAAPNFATHYFRQGVCPTVEISLAPPPVQFHTHKCNFIGQDHARGSRLEDEDGNGIIPLNDCLPVCPREAACLSPLGRSVLVTLPPAARRPPPAPGQFCHFDSSLLSSVRTKNEVADRASHRSL